MRVITATVIGGKVDLPLDIADGSAVTILAPDGDEAIDLSADQERELSESLAEIRAGRYVDGRQLLDGLKARRDA